MPRRCPRVRSSSAARHSTTPATGAATTTVCRLRAHQRRCAGAAEQLGALRARRRDRGPKAKAAAGDANVMVHGADLAQSMLREGLLDQLQIHLIPVLLGQGRRLFSTDRIELELGRVLQRPASPTSTSE